MRKFIAIIILSFVSLGTYAQDQYRVSTRSVLNIRSSASTNARVIGSLRNGTMVDVYNNEYGWAKIYYGGTEAYISSHYIELVQTEAQIQQQIEDSQIPWYDLMGWGVIGWLLRWVIIPFVVLCFGLMIPVMLLGEIRFLNNFFFGLLSLIVLYLLASLYISIFHLFDVYCGTGETIILWVLAVTWGIGSVTKGVNNRCPNCHYNSSTILESFIRSTVRTTKTSYTDGSTNTSRSTTNVTHDRRECPECGYQWWTEE